jgi:hypothetical protein
MKNETNKRPQRTPAEIIAETEAKLERLRTKEAKQAAQSHPALASLIVEKTDVQKEIREAKKILGNGPQSADARMAKHYAWIEQDRGSRRRMLMLSSEKPSLVLPTLMIKSRSRSLPSSSRKKWKPRVD